MKNGATQADVQGVDREADLWRSIYERMRSQESAPMIGTSVFSLLTLWHQDRIATALERIADHMEARP